MIAEFTRYRRLYFTLVIPIFATVVADCVSAQTSSEADRSLAENSARIKTDAITWLNTRTPYIEGISSQIWHNPEIAHHEFETSDLLINESLRAGFSVDRGVAGLPTAFVASYGSGSPKIGIVALLDALPGMSQNSDLLKREPLNANAPGHGCGHNLICAADLGAVLAVKHAITEFKLSGTIIFFGAPAEEIYHGGVYMVREGVFDQLDALLFWHPSSVTTVISQSGLAMNSIRYLFKGLASDATDAAHLGRNALSAVEDFTSKIRELKRDFPQHTVVNHVVTEGGRIPSVVPERAEAWYFIHARDRETVSAVTAMITERAERAARKSETALEVQFLSGANEWLINGELANLLHNNLAAATEPKYSESELGHAKRLQLSFNQHGKQPMFRGVLPSAMGSEPVHISDDTADASWIIPRGGFLVACFPEGVASHTWQWTSAAKSSVAHRGPCALHQS